MFIQKTYLAAFAKILLVFGLLLALCAMLAGVGNRFGWWDYHIGIAFLKWTAYGEAIAITLSLLCLAVAVFRAKNTVLLFIIGTVIGLSALAIPALMWTTSHRVPPIHDITTDTQNPPKFVAIVKLRRDASNPVEYGGARVAMLQHMAYPDILPLEITEPPDNAFALALTAARKMGWEIVDANAHNGLIEATTTTFWFGFKDDVVVRITAQKHGSRIDVRSASRVGISDLGANAERIRTFLVLLRRMQSSNHLK